MSASSSNQIYLAPVDNAPPPVPVKYTALKMGIYVKAGGATEAAEFYKLAFGAVELHRDVRHVKIKKKQSHNNAADQVVQEEDKTLISIQMSLDGFLFHVSDIVMDGMTDTHKLQSVGSRDIFFLRAADMEAVIKRAETAGAIGMGEKAASRVGKVMMMDPYGNIWVIYSAATTGERSSTLKGGKACVYVDGSKVIEASEFYKAAFGAKEVIRTMNITENDDNDQPYLSIDLKIGNLDVIVVDSRSNCSSTPNGTSLFEADDLEGAHDRAILAGAKLVGGNLDHGQVRFGDSYDKYWIISCPKEVVSEAEDTSGSTF